MATAVNEVTHYTSYKARPFTREQRDNTTILFGGLTWKHERLVQGVFNNLNYNAKPLPNIARADLDAGKELIDTGACCPTIFTTGSLVNFLKTEVAANGKQKTLDDYVFLTAGACGPCRFGQYHESYEMALDGMGLKDFRLFLLAQDQLDQAPEKGGGLEINMPLSLGIVWAILVRRHPHGHGVPDSSVRGQSRRRPTRSCRKARTISSRFSRSGRFATTSTGCWRGISSPAISRMRCAWCARNSTRSKSTACR